METTKPRIRRKADQDYAMLAIRKELHKEVKAFCAANGYTMISFVEALLKSYINRQNEQQRKEKLEE